MKMPHSRRTFLLALAALALIPAAGRAQGPVRERVRVAMEETALRLELAETVVANSDDAAVHREFDLARDLQERARSAEEAGRYLGALQLTMGARDRCLRALRLCRGEENVQQAAERALGRTDQLLARGRDRLEPGGPGRRAAPRWRGAPLRAGMLQEDAWRQFRAGRFEASLRLTLAARRLAQRGAGRGPWAR